MKLYGSFLFAAILGIFIVGCPNSTVEPYRSTTPAATEAGMVSVKPTEAVLKSLTFYLITNHPVNSIWKVYDESGAFRSDIAASFRRVISPEDGEAAYCLTLTALEDDLAAGVYHVSVTEPGKDESERLALRARNLFPIEILFDANGGAFAGAGNATTAVVEKDEDGDVTLEWPAHPGRDAHLFLGWNERPNGSGEDFTAASPITGDKKVYAKWTALNTPFTVTFDAVNGSFADAGATTTVNGSFTESPQTLAAMPAIPNRTQLSFDGWNTRPNGTGTAFDRNSVITSENLTVYAQWKDSTEPNLQLFYDFGLRDGKIKDLSGGSNDGTMRGTGGSTGSKQIGTQWFHYYKTGDKKAMSNAEATWLDLGAGAGAILNAATQGYTMSAYVNIGGDWTGNGNFVWAFADTNAVGQYTGQGLWSSAKDGNSSHATTSGGWDGSNAKSVAKSGAFTKSTWYHVAYTQDGKTGTNGKLYINGAPAVEGSIPYLPSDFAGFGSPSSHNALGGPCFTGDYNLSQTMFTDFRIYDAALTAAQIAALAGDLGALNSVTDWE
ncbi:MAG: InlB B-repeat-containing protein [Treponema sp.]|jgi:hypothetical protein|nr:InlB B-repeat-containing protein [Treponema sp.]